MSGGRGGDADGGQDLALLPRGEERRLVILPGRHGACAVRTRQFIDRIERLQDRRHVVSGIAVRRVAADRADIADLGIGDLQRRLADDRAGFVERIRGDQFRLGRHGAEPDRAAGNFDEAQGVDVLQVDQVLGHCQTQLHHRDQAVAAGNDGRVVAKRRQQADGFVDSFRAMVVKCPRVSCASSTPDGLMP